MPATLTRGGTVGQVSEASEDVEPADPTETIEELRRSFFYGSRSNLNVKFLKDLSDAEFGDFLSELFAGVAHSMDTGDPGRTIDALHRWQIEAYRGHLGDPTDFPHRHDDTPFSPLTKPLAECRVALVTSSGHFVEGDDPRPLGVEAMTQAEAEARIGEFIREAPTLSTIPVDTPIDRLRVRHGGYPVEAVAADHQVVLPIQHLRDLAADGIIGELAPEAYSFVGATSQVRLRKDRAPAWAERLRDIGADVVLLVPI